MERFSFVTVSVLVVALLLATGLALALSELEPNDTTAQANSLPPDELMGGAVSPVADHDWYALPGVNVTWGFVALLETDGASGSQEATLSAFGNDGTTLLREDSGSWERGSAIALQNFANGGETHYLRVNETGDDAALSTYTLRYYQTIVRSQPEVEPNESPASATPSGFTHEGILSSGSDRDCYAFQGRAGDTILLALDGDPEGDGSVADPLLELIGPGGATLATANFSGPGGQEFLEYPSLATADVYTYCVANNATTGTPDATYRVGIVRNGALYFPDYRDAATWLDRPPRSMVGVGDTLTFRLTVTNTSPLAIPGDVEISARFDPVCLAYQNATPAPTDSDDDQIYWYGLKPEGLAPGEGYSVTVTMLALARCRDNFHQSTVISYYFTGFGDDALYQIGDPLFLPLLARP